MKASINRDECISCGFCADACPEVFRMADDDLAEVYVEEVPTDLEDKATEARDGCPVSIIDLD